MLLLKDNLSRNAFRLQCSRCTVHSLCSAQIHLILSSCYDIAHDEFPSASARGPDPGWLKLSQA